MYLGAGVFIHKGDWLTVNKKQKDSLWILNVIRVFYPNGVKDKCIDIQKAGSRFDGQIRTPITPKKLKQ